MVGITEYPMVIKMKEPNFAKKSICVIIRKTEAPVVVAAPPTTDTPISKMARAVRPVRVRSLASMYLED